MWIPGVGVRGPVSSMEDSAAGRGETGVQWAMEMSSAIGNGSWGVPEPAAPGAKQLAMDGGAAREPSYPLATPEEQSRGPGCGGGTDPRELRHSGPVVPSPSGSPSSPKMLGTWPSKSMSEMNAGTSRRCSIMETLRHLKLLLMKVSWMMSLERATEPEP